MKNHNLPDTWNAILYLRISKEDRNRLDESNSIKNQRDLLLDFVGRNPDIRVAQVLSDDGATGANFDREKFKEMIRLIEDGAVDCCIVKDFSRLGRDHIETGKYIERYFDSQNVRFISVNDNYDSLKSNMSDSNNSLIVPFKNIINEATLEDISTKTKTHLEISRKNGEFVCNYAPYGYTKSDDKKLIVDEYASDIVRGIFERKLSGSNEQQIATALNATGVLSPAEYKRSLGSAYYTPFAVKEKSLWTANAIKRILTNRVYIGYLEQGKRTKASYRVKKYFYKPREAWSVHENDHEPIVNEYDFELVQELLKKDVRVSPETGQLQLFSGIIVCGSCGQPMTVRISRKNGKSYIYYICSTHKRFGTCKNVSVNAKAVERFVLLSIQNQIDGLVSVEELADGLNLDAMKSRKKAAIEGMIDTALGSIREYNDYLVKSYAHLIDGVITDSEYRLFRDEFRRQIGDSEHNIARLRGELEQLSDDTKTRELIERFKSDGNITELTRRAVVSLIEAVIVRDSKDLEIRFRYANGLEPQFCGEERAVA
ncbi:MAG: recombinase family protein [Oscillospiraceae bacterium]|jgi:DNA invertase Pin-like site-specific DNA recombinase|nr:recombinase family protein [Oscillospiraceae bacterium]